MIVSGDDIKAFRKAKRLSRTALVELLGDPWTVGKLNLVETKGRAIKPLEMDALRRVMGNGVTPASAPEPQAPDVYYQHVSPASLPATGYVPMGMYTTEFEWPEDVPQVPVNDDPFPEEDVWEPVMFLDAVSDAPTTIAPPAAEVAEAVPSALPLTDILPFPTHYQPEPEEPVGPVGVDALYKEINGDYLRRISNSEVQTFKHCRRRWWLGWYRGLVLKARKVTGPAPLGTRLHEALSHYYVPEGTEQRHPVEALDAILQRDQAALVANYGDTESEALLTALADFSKEADLARAMLEGYMEWIAETGYDSQYEVIAPEVVLEAIIEAASNHRFILAGQLDVRLRRRHDGVNLLMDHKSVQNFDAPRLRLQLDEQMKTYLLLEHENRQLDEARVEGALYNMMRRVKRTGNAKPPFYERLEIMHNPNVIANFKERLKGEALTINHVEQCLREEVPHNIIVYPTPSDACRWKCEFNAVCSMLDDDSRAEQFISEHYVQINPLDRYDKAKEEI